MSPRTPQRQQRAAGHHPRRGGAPGPARAVAEAGAAAGPVAVPAVRPEARRRSRLGPLRPDSEIGWGSVGRAGRSDHIGGGRADGRCGRDDVRTHYLGTLDLPRLNSTHRVVRRRDVEVLARRIGERLTIRETAEAARVDDHRCGAVIARSGAGAVSGCGPADPVSPRPAAARQRLAAADRPRPRRPGAHDRGDEDPRSVTAPCVGACPAGPGAGGEGRARCVAVPARAAGGDRAPGAARAPGRIAEPSGTAKPIR